MKQFTSILILFLMCACLQAAPSNVVAVSGCNAYPPYSFSAMRDGKPVPSGMDTEIVDAVFTRMQRKIQLQLVPSRNLIRCKPCSYEWPRDVPSPQPREEWRLRTPSVVFATRKDGALTKWGNLDDLKSCNIGVIAGYTYDNCGPFWQAKKLKKTEFFSGEELLAALKDGKVDLVVGEQCALVWYAKKTGMQDQLRILPKPLYEEGQYMSFTDLDKNAQLIADFQQALAEFKKTEAYAAILKKWETGDYELPVIETPN